MSELEQLVISTTTDWFIVCITVDVAPICLSNYGSIWLPTERPPSPFPAQDQSLTFGGDPLPSTNCCNEGCKSVHDEAKWAHHPQTVEMWSSKPRNSAHVNYEQSWWKRTLMESNSHQKQDWPTTHHKYQTLLPGKLSSCWGSTINWLILSSCLEKRTPVCHLIGEPQQENLQVTNN